MIAGPWVSVWARRGKNYAEAFGIEIPKTFDWRVPTWGHAKEVLAIRIKRHAGVPNPNGKLDGDYRKIVSKYITKWEPKIVDARQGKNGWAYNSSGSWGGKRSLDGLYLVGHYTGGLGSLANDAAYHVNGQGWRNLSYHFAVDRDGTLYWSNDCDDLTWHARGFNTKGIGISFVGNDDGPTDAQKRTLKWFIDGAFSTGIPFLGVPKLEKGTVHGDSPYSTSCPGTYGRIFYEATMGKHYTRTP